ncbi:hypothetical protein EBME_0651 [bacterium endosymbiont of Mortierella elongata FMR23-6]|nr:hypothetical protein EBME_0651 [bacterium endosymbiont of Mortierella elongata FMR23-6]
MGVEAGIIIGEENRITEPEPGEGPGRSRLFSRARAAGARI